MKNNVLNEISHLLMTQYIKPNDIAIDMTMGNGIDTIHLARLSHHVYAFDIQDKALESTQEKLIFHKLYNVVMIKDSHVNLLNYAKNFNYVVFNLGYLPSGDKSITTKSETTLEAVKIAIKHVQLNGFVQLMIYTGHDEGQLESELIDAYLKKLSHLDYRILKIGLPYQDNHPPYIVLIHKINKKDET